MHFARISCGGPVHRINTACGQVCTFEMHPVCGPILVNPITEDPLDKQPGPRAPFWQAVGAWVQQGQVVDPQGLCVWSMPERPSLVHLGGNNYALANSNLASRYGKQVVVDA